MPGRASAMAANCRFTLASSGGSRGGCGACPATMRISAPCPPMAGSCKGEKMRSSSLIGRPLTKATRAARAIPEGDQAYRAANAERRPRAASARDREWCHRHRAGWLSWSSPRAIEARLSWSSSGTSPDLYGLRPRFSYNITRKCRSAAIVQQQGYNGDDSTVQAWESSLFAGKKLQSAIPPSTRCACPVM